MDEKTLECYSSRIKETTDLYRSCKGKGVSNYFPQACIAFHHEVNNQKRDKLPTREFLRSRRDVLVGCWNVIQRKYPSRFNNEFRKNTGLAFADNWHLSPFSTVSGAVEITALQRGIERWGG
ncbi:MAG TPA: hypothetical protein PKX40_14960 [Spirochaetota bacterium]|nr:hypothetical protein [Spirochaetota bacterium]